MPTIASALLLLGLATSPPRLHVDIVFQRVTVPPQLAASAIEEAALIWAPYGVDVRQSNTNAPRRDDAVRLVVRFADRQNRRVPAHTLGSIDFVGDLPEREIVLYPAAISELVTAALHHGENEWPIAYRERIQARVLGRALAHEIGHFLLRLRSHSSVGLMREHQVAPDLIVPERHRFVLSTGEVTRLDAVISTFFELRSR